MTANGNTAGATVDVRARLDAVRAALAGIAPAEVAVGVRHVSGDDWSALPAAERRLVAAAVRSRRDAFASGRALLHSLVGSFEPILIGPTGAPVLADDLVGSLAHDAEVAVAVLGRRMHHVALGVDVEVIGAVEPDLAGIVLRDDEADLDPTLGFVLKEAAYKVWSNAGGALIGHHEMRVEVDQGAFVATVVAAGASFRGAYVAAADRWLAVSWSPVGGRATGADRPVC